VPIAGAIVADGPDATRTRIVQLRLYGASFALEHLDAVDRDHVGTPGRKCRSSPAETWLDGLGPRLDGVIA
jgi:hypothetical protein